MCEVSGCLLLITWILVLVCHKHRYSMTFFFYLIVGFLTNFGVIFQNHFDAPIFCVNRHCFSFAMRYNDDHLIKCSGFSFRLFS